MLKFFCFLFLSASTITSSLCANSVINQDIQKINSAYVLESSFEELEEVLQEDEFLNYKKQFEDNLQVENYLDYEELVALSKNYKYKKFFEIHSFEHGNVVLCAIVQLDKDNRVTYVYPYTISPNNSWAEVGAFYDITELTYSTEIMVGCIGKYNGKDSIVTRTPTIRSFLSIEHELFEKN